MSATGILDRMLRAINSHDIGALVDCFAHNYRCEDPAASVSEALSAATPSVRVDRTVRARARHRKRGCCARLKTATRCGASGR